MVGQRVGMAGEHLTGARMATAPADALGEPVRYHAVPLDVYRSPGFPGADDLGNMFQLKHDFEVDFCGARSLEVGRALNPSLRTFTAWLADNTERLPIDSA